ncbi:DNA cytosine methyltransferase [Hellea balneolensis]|uniref:DNA cytosine methyltransferase n=1 Tax=Hellea balneolensis TaxID=287478 RepID=UPI0003F8CA29|nr:DNA cytosine methyltransferase [Hellea balneolensis]
MGKAPTVFDLFCGAGGLSLGFQQADFRVLGGNDFFKSAGQTFSNAHENSKFYDMPIQELKGNHILSDMSMKRGDLDCLVGGPPCQAYSVYNHKRSMDDERANLFKEYLRIVDELYPKWIVIENVTGIKSIDNGQVIETIRTELNDRGYEIEVKTLFAEDYGIPQERRRVIFLGNRINAPIHWPKKTHTAENFVTIFDSISDLPELENGEKLCDGTYLEKPKSNYQRNIRKNSLKITNHDAPKLGAVNIERLKFIKPGGSWRDIPHDLLPNGMKSAKRSDHTKRYGRMKWDGMSCTILTKCDIHWGAYIHPEQDRAITVREAARIQGFPDHVEFFGNKTEQYVQVGNAVPPILGKAIAKTILPTINSIKNSALNDETV